jgi:hypothetical protein
MWGMKIPRVGGFVMALTIKEIGNAKAKDKNANWLTVGVCVFEVPCSKRFMCFSTGSDDRSLTRPNDVR